MNSTSNAGFGPVLAVRSLLSDLTVPYWIAGGWAIDLAVGRVTRDHADVDIMLLERDEHALRTDLTQVDVQLTGRDGQPGPWPAGRRLLAGPEPGPPRPIAAPGRLVLRVGSLPLPAEVLLAPPAANQEDIANLLRGTPRLNVLITRTVPGVSGQCRIAVIGLKPIDRALTITSLMTAATSVNGAALARYTIARRRGTNEGVLCTHRTGTAGRAIR